MFKCTPYAGCVLTRSCQHDIVKHVQVDCINMPLGVTAAQSHINKAIDSEAEPGPGAEHIKVITHAYVTCMHVHMQPGVLILMLPWGSFMLSVQCSITISVHSLRATSTARSLTQAARIRLGQPFSHAATRTHCNMMLQALTSVNNTTFTAGRTLFPGVVRCNHVQLSCCICSSLQTCQTEPHPKGLQGSR